MKKITAITLLAIFIMVGCMEDNSIVGPTNDLTLEQLPKGRPILGLDYDYLWDDSSSVSKDYDISLDKESAQVNDISDDRTKNSLDEPIINSNRYSWSRKKGGN